MKETKARIEQWGDGLAVRIPPELAERMGVAAGEEVRLSMVGHSLRVVPMSVPTLEELVAGITEENRHDEIYTGPPVGREVW